MAADALGQQLASMRGDFFKKNLSMTVLSTFVVFIFMALILPFPGWLLDVMMICNVLLSLTILLVVLYTPKSSDFSSFPRVVLFNALFGIALNFSSTKYILAEGGVGFKKFDAEMIKAFSDIITRGTGLKNLVIGVIIFIILIVVQKVITNGATRVSEVAARFALDSMAQKLFGVDADVQAGILTDQEAIAKKNSIRAESDFYASMDGSSKFVGGYVTAGIFITIVNLVGGIVIGMFLQEKNQMNFSEACGTFSRLTIGDGLLSQIPSLLMSFSTAILVTGNNSEVVVGEQFKQQFRVNGNVFLISGIVIVLMGIGFFFVGDDIGISLLISFLIIGGLVAYYGWGMVNGKFADAKTAERIAQTAQKAETKSAPADNSNAPIPAYVPVDSLSLEIGYALIALASPEEKEDGTKVEPELIKRIKKMRQELGIDLGVVIPSVRVLDNMQLEPNEYSFKMQGIEKGRFKLKPNYYMCLNTGGVTKEMEGEATQDPTFGMPAIWVSEDQRMDAEANGYAVIDAPTLIITHITEILRNNAAEVLGRKEVAAILDKLKEENSVIVNEVLDTYKFTYGEIQQVLQGLLRERISIRNIVAILENMANYGKMPHNPWMLLEKVREGLGLQICSQYADQDKVLSVINLSQDDAEYVSQHIVDLMDGKAPVLAFDPEDKRKWIKGWSDVVSSLRSQGILPIVICQSEIRYAVKESVEREMPGIVVLSFYEYAAASNNIKLKVIGEIKCFPK